MDNKITILAVDDEPLNREILMELLEDDFSLEQAASGQECLQKLAQGITPELILLDVNMPKMNGLEVCRKLKENQQSADIPVIFVSALSTLEERMAGYEAGGEDYITKPFDPEELLVKIRQTLDNESTKKQLEKNSQEVMNTAMMAITSSGEMGVVMHFMRDSFSCHDYDSLSKLALNSLLAYDLQGGIAIQGKDKLRHYSTSGVVSPLEVSVYEYMLEKGRLVTSGKRMMVNFNTTSLLITNMPLEDEEKFGRLRDHLAVLAEAVDARVRALQVEMDLATQRTALENIMQTTRMTLADVSQDFKKQQIASSAILSDMSSKMESTYMNLGLSEEQEQTLNQNIENAEKGLFKIFERGKKLNKKFDAIVAGIETVLNAEPSRNF